MAMINVTHQSPIHHGSVGHRPLALTSPHTGPRQLLAGAPATKRRVSRRKASAMVAERRQQLGRKVKR